MEVKGYRQLSEPRVYSLYDCDTVLDYIEEMPGDQIVVVETSQPYVEEVKVYFFVREDGEQLGLNIKDKG